MSIVFSARISDPQLIAAVQQYAADHKVGEGTALARLALEGLKAKEGKSINRFALLDPAAQNEYSLALGELRSLHKALNKTSKALAKTRPLDDDDLLAWERDVFMAREALKTIPAAYAKLRDAGKFQAVLLHADPNEFTKLYSPSNWVKFPNLMALLGAVLGKPTTPPKVVTEAQPVTAASA